MYEVAALLWRQSAPEREPLVGEPARPTACSALAEPGRDPRAQAPRDEDDGVRQHGRGMK